MFGKRGNTGIYFSKNGQISVFIIVGIITLFIFLSLLQLSVKFQTKQLQQAKEDVYSSLFSREALRIYVDKCLNEGLSQGLDLLGRQGRIWNDQPGGRETFAESLTGVTVGANRVAYGIIDKSYQQHPNAYPCPDDADNPEFCQYKYPLNSAQFGLQSLDKRFIQADLERYLRAYTVACVESLVSSEIKGVAGVETSEEASFKLAINPGVITVKVNYPLKFSAGKQEFFQISQFDFTYPSFFDQLLTSVILFPLRNDQKYVDYDFSFAQLTQPSFTYKSDMLTPNYCDFTGSCRQSTRSAQLESLSARMKINSLPTGDDLYQFTLPRSSIIFGSSGDYEYQVARQNRPPALDYLGRAECPISGYDYLVIPGDPTLGTIDLSLSALDPDEDQIQFSFEKPEKFPVTSPASSNRYIADSASVSSIPVSDTPYLFRAIASDTKKNDYQEVRVLVASPLQTALKILSPFTGSDAVKNAEGAYVLSREDPYFLDLSYLSSASSWRNREVTLEYQSQLGVKNQYRFPLVQSGNCLAAPFELNALTSGDNNIVPCDPQLSFYQDSAVIKQFRFQDALQAVTIDPTVTDKGIYQLTAVANYCGNNLVVSSSQVQVEVKGCYPFRGVDNSVVPRVIHPYAYPYHEKNFPVQPDGSTDLNPNLDKTINPFFANHACCLGDPALPDTWGIAPADTKCYQDPSPGCYGKLPNYVPPDQIKGYVLETLFNTCDGKRGNTCQGGLISELSDGKLVCGSLSLPSCNKVHTNCQGKGAWSYVTLNDGTIGWCNGQMGCEQFSTEEVVVESGVNYLPNIFFDMNNEAITRKSANNIQLKVHPGCTPSDAMNHFSCDSDHDGKFEGTCISAGKCQGD